MSTADALRYLGACAQVMGLPLDAATLFSASRWCDTPQDRNNLLFNAGGAAAYARRRARHATRGGSIGVWGDTDHRDEELMVADLFDRAARVLREAGATNPPAWQTTVKTMGGEPGETVAPGPYGTQLRTQRRMSGRHAPGFARPGGDWIDGTPVDTVEQAQAEALRMALDAAPARKAERDRRREDN